MKRVIYDSAHVIFSAFYIKNMHEITFTNINSVVFKTWIFNDQLVCRCNARGQRRGMVVNCVYNITTS